ncbi:MAG: HAD-IA family hydrolase [Cyanobacteria bacterium P01_A01_bin.135]
MAVIALRCSDSQLPSGDNRHIAGVSAVLFDKDGTLADPTELLTRIGRQRARLIDAKVPGVQEPLLMAFGISADGLDPAGLMSVGSRWETEVAAAAYVAETGHGWREAIALVQDSFAQSERGWGRKADHTPLYADALPCLRRLHGAGLRLGIASADTPENLQDFVERYRLAPYFTTVLGSDRRLAKPEREFLTRACDDLGVTPSELLVIGDSASDFDLARQGPAAGCALVNRDGGVSNMENQTTQVISAQIIPSLDALQPC